MPRARAAFSLIEILITITIIALISGVAMQSFRRSFDSEARQLTSKIQGTMKFFYNAAATSGNTYRLVFDFGDKEGNQRIGVEMTEGAYVAAAPATDASLKKSAHEKEADKKSGAGGGASSMSALGRAARQKKEKGDSTAGGSDEYVPPTLELKSSVNATFSRASGPHGVLQDYLLPAKVKLDRIIFPKPRAPITEGKGYVNFYPGGYMDAVTIVLTNDAHDRFFALTTNALTGSTRISREEPGE